VLPLCLGALPTYSLKLITGDVSFRVVKFEKDKSVKGLIAHYVFSILRTVSTIKDRPFLKALKYCLQHAQQASKISAKEEGKRLFRMEKFFSENFPQNFLLFEESENQYIEAKRQEQVPSEADAILQEIRESSGLQQLDLVQDRN
jgi:hypothetical protein